jgi:hypothetical protein
LLLACWCGLVDNVLAKSLEMLRLLLHLEVVLLLHLEVALLLHLEVALLMLLRAKLEVFVVQSGEWSQCWLHRRDRARHHHHHGSLGRGARWQRARGAGRQNHATEAGKGHAGAPCLRSVRVKAVHLQAKAASGELESDDGFYFRICKLQVFGSPLL